jgi:hypothetical protein
MHVCMHVCVCMYVCMHVCMYVCMCVCVCTAWGMRLASGPAAGQVWNRPPPPGDRRVCPAYTVVFGAKARRIRVTARYVFQKYSARSSFQWFGIRIPIRCRQKHTEWGADSVECALKNTSRYGVEIAPRTDVSKVLKIRYNRCTDFTSNRTPGTSSLARIPSYFDSSASLNSPYKKKYKNSKIDTQISPSQNEFRIACVCKFRLAGR